MDQTKLQIRIINGSSIQESGCWGWLKGKDKIGYGYFKIQGKSNTAHRASFFAWNGSWPEVVRHACDNSSCVNPDHLLAGTHADNVADRVERGRSARGSKNGRSKLTEDQVRNIKVLLSNGMSPRHIASDHGVDPKVIRDIRQNKKWQHVK